MSDKGDTDEHEQQVPAARASTMFLGSRTGLRALPLLSLDGDHLRLYVFRLGQGNRQDAIFGLGLGLF